jgi:hypothetical protein
MSDVNIMPSGTFGSHIPPCGPGKSYATGIHYTNVPFWMEGGEMRYGKGTKFDEVTAIVDTASGEIRRVFFNNKDYPQGPSQGTQEGLIESRVVTGTDGRKYTETSWVRLHNNPYDDPRHANGTLTGHAEGRTFVTAPLGSRVTAQAGSSTICTENVLDAFKGR